MNRCDEECHAYTKRHLAHGSGFRSLSKRTGQCPDAHLQQLHSRHAVHDDAADLHSQQCIVFKLLLSMSLQSQASFSQTDVKFIPIPNLSASIHETKQAYPKIKDVSPVGLTTRPRVRPRGTLRLSASEITLRCNQFRTSFLISNAQPLDSKLLVCSPSKAPARKVFPRCSQKRVRNTQGSNQPLYTDGCTSLPQNLVVSLSSCW